MVKSEAVATTERTSLCRLASDVARRLHNSRPVLPALPAACSTLMAGLLHKPHDEVLTRGWINIFTCRCVGPFITSLRMCKFTAEIKNTKKF